MALGLRQRDILEIAQAEGRVAVEALAARFGVSVQTIRRDLAALEAAGALDRVHGGAVARVGVANVAYASRQGWNAAAKAAIARACAAAIPENSSVILNIGTTTEAVARALMGHRNLTVITNNLNVANILAGNPGCEVVVAGGMLRRSDGGLVGELTTDVFAQFKVDLAVIGCSAVDAEGEVLDFDLAEVRVSRAILGRARRAWLVADHSKFRRSAPARLASLAEIDALYTDRPLEPALAQACAGWGTNVQVAGG